MSTEHGVEIASSRPSLMQIRLLISVAKVATPLAELACHLPALF